MSTFDAANFLNTVYTDTNATQYVPIPEGIFPCMTGIPNVASGVSAKSTDGKPWYRLDLPIIIDDAGVREAMGRDEVKSKFSVMLDVEDGVLSTATGRNVQLGRLREALGLNEPGQEFTLTMLSGKAAKCQVSHRAHPSRPGEVIADVTEIAPL